MLKWYKKNQVKKSEQKKITKLHIKVIFTYKNKTQKTKVVFIYKNNLTKHI